MGPPLVDTFVTSARTAGDLLTSAPVRDRWDTESACAGMTVGGLAFHLASQAGNAVRLVSAAPSDESPIPVEEHYRRAAWVSSGPDEEANVVIRSSANDEAGAGFDELCAKVAADLEALPGVLDARSSHHPVLIPWQGWALTRDDFLVTRLMEMLVHSDDLAASLDVPTPQFPGEAVRRVLGLLTSVAVERHGQTALLRALSRPQRAPGSVSAF
ncbi:maleylpyruvate isomerase N-terminal domain-containing protein [Nocardioides dilutus]